MRDVERAIKNNLQLILRYKDRVKGPEENRSDERHGGSHKKFAPVPIL